ncbi:hypothetical protein DCS_03703 [Drechmeria coniospora]|uniref:Uncharacterized protein n=1 Tax=Drechmeria coniospora TaxID=98403 RepID=A0A151GHZ0_DRECN|nr:hypothetical protein DCS_03703 [Drechmeria coniospora]KYK56700.1 hypothetical protein DCS_03703 [Drechmeria coniospora]
MGSTETKPAPEGCFYIWRATLKFDCDIDCDCQLQRACLKGEPSMPPLDEFVQLELPRDAYSHCPVPTLPHTQVLAQVQGQPELAGDDDDVGRRSPKDGPSDSNLYHRSLRIALDNLRRDKQEALEVSHSDSIEMLRCCGTANPSCGHHHCPRSHQDVDPGFVMDLLLAEPGELAEQVVESFPMPMARTMLQCSRRAVFGTIQRARSQATRTAGKVLSFTGRPAPTEPRGHSHLVLLQHAVGQWMKNTPPALSRDLPLIRHVAGGDYDPGANSVTTDTPTRSFNHAAVDAMCDQVYDRAVANAEGQGRDGDRDGEGCDAHHARLMRALENRRPTLWSSGLVKASVGAPAAASNHSLGWDCETLTAAFGPMFPSLAVGLTFFALSLHMEGLVGEGSGYELEPR